MRKRMYQNHERNKDGSPYYSNFKTIKGRVVNVGKHHQKDMTHHVYAHDMEPELKAGDGKREKDIVRFYADPNKNYRVMQRGVSKRQAWLHTNDPSTKKDGVYFDAMAKADDY